MFNIWYVFLCVCSTAGLVFANTIDESSNRKAKSILSGIQSTRESVPACRFSLEESVEMVDRKGVIERFPSKWNVTLNSNEVLFLRVEGTSSTRSSILRSNEIVHSSDESAVVQGLATGSAAYAFNPRLLGICMGPFENSSMSNSLRSKDQSKLSWEMVELNSTRLCKVVIIDYDGTELSFWVEPERAFRVHKYEYLSPSFHHELASVRDGLLTTIMLAETIGTFLDGVRTQMQPWIIGGLACGRGEIPWNLSPRPEVSFMGDRYNSIFFGFGSSHNTVNVANVNTSTRRLSRSIDWTVLYAKCGMADSVESENE